LAVDPIISLSIIRREIEECKTEPLLKSVKLSDVNEASQAFTVEMTSPKDNEVYKLVIKFDNYKEQPLYMDFIDPITGKEGTKNAYPSCNGPGGEFFHQYPCICNPCNRKSYLNYAQIHREWDLATWQSNPQVGSLTNLRNILLAINKRIRNPDSYNGRMRQN
jgi:hypothetical protein